MNEGLTMSESVAEGSLVRYVIQFQSPHRDDWQDCAVESYATVEQMRSRAMGAADVCAWHTLSNCAVCGSSIHCRAFNNFVG